MPSDTPYLSLCPCPADPPPPAAALLHIVAPPQGALHPSRKMAPWSWGDTRPKLLRRGGEGRPASHSPDRRDLCQTPPPWDLYAELEGAILDWNNRHLKRIRRTNQPLSSSAVAVAEQNPNKLGWKGDTWSDRETEEKETAGHRQPAKKKERSSATNATFLQVRQSDAGGNSSFLPGLEEALVFLTTSPIEPGIKKRRCSPFFLSLLPFACFLRPDSSVEQSF
ncbi:hypothetical protein F7725_000578 [Dissostichus mawsoni]|uniref:Uncharacterized protein n=1 Tax=Dissostichus mawsoni TaxID=36200 RepID=A0A7J5ZFF2_DISMA|nr:hypothetical protein F7725_000578 [Dissostichus mawsoni]